MASSRKKHCHEQQRFSGMSYQNIRLLSCGDNGTIYFYTHGEGSIDVSTAGGTYTFTAVPDEGSSFKGYYKQNALTDLVTSNATITFPVSQSSKVYRHASFETCSHSYTSKTTAATCTKDGSITYTCTICGDSYSEEIEAIGHSYTSKKTAATCSKDGSITYTCKNCSHSYSEVIKATGHNYTSAKTSATCTKDGSTTYTCKNCGDSYSEVIEATGHSYTSVKTDATCTTAGGTTYTCENCDHSYVETTPATGHSYVKGTCTVCGEKDPDYIEYYLVGYINGADYGCEGDYANTGIYKFVGGKLTVTFETASYVFIKTGDNANWYMSEGYCQLSSVTLYNTSKALVDPNKLFVPGGVEITFTLTVNSNDTLTLSYEKGQCNHEYTSAVTAPTCEKDGYTTYTCTNCGESHVGNIVLSTGHSYLDNVCRICGEKAVDDETPVGNLFTLTGANMVLGGELDMNFFIEPKKLTGTDYYAMVTIYTEDETITNTIPYGDWEVRTS